MTAFTVKSTVLLWSEQVSKVKVDCCNSNRANDCCKDPSIANTERDFKNSN